jgi:imidazolonepropionase-like amidohydrolase
VTRYVLIALASVTAGQPSPSGGTVIDATGMSAMPGFIDAHRR